MSQIQFLTPAQEALIPEYQQKWRNLYLSTQPIDPIRAAAAVKGAYAVMGKQEPEVVFCTSPRAALQRLEDYVEQVQFTHNSTIPSQEDIQKNFVQFFAKGVWETIKLRNKQQQAGTKPLHDLSNQVWHEAAKYLAKYIEERLPKDLSTQDIVEQAFIGASPLFTENFGSSWEFNDQNSENWQESFRMTATNVDKQLGWLPGKGLLFRGWLKSMLQGAITGRIYGTKHPQFYQVIFASLSFPEQKFIRENPPVIISNLAISCTWLDFAFAVLNYPHNSQQWTALQGLVKYCGEIFAVDDFCIVCERPTKIIVNENNQIHGEGEAALEFADGFTVYAHSDTPLPEKYGAIHPSQWQAQWVLEERNSQIQEILIKEIGAVRLCQELSWMEVDAIAEYTLLKSEKLVSQDDYILKRINAETGEINAAFIPWNIKSVWSAIKYANKEFSQEDFPLP